MSETNNSNLKPMSLTAGRTWTISSSGGQLSYITNNLPLQSLMEALEEELKNTPPWDIEKRIKG